MAERTGVAEPARAVWRALIRFEAEKIIPEVAVRNTLGFAAAVILGTVFASPSTGVVAGLGALNVAYTDGRDPYAQRARRMGISALLSGVTVTLGALSGHSNVAAVIVAGLWAFAAGMMVALGTAATDLGVITLVTLVVFAAKPLAPMLAIETGLVALGGGALQGLISTFLWPVRRYEPERRLIADLYGGLAGIAEDSSPAASAPPMSVQISDAQDALAPLARDHSVEAERHVFLLVQAERIRLSILNLGRLQRRLRRHVGGAAGAEALQRVFDTAAEALRFVSRRLGAPSAVEHSPERFTPALGELQGLQTSASTSFHAALLRDAHHQANALRSQILSAASAASGTRKDPYPSQPQIAGREPWRLRFQGTRARLLANLSLDSTVFRHAVRLAWCLAAGDAIGRSLSLQRTYWIPMTIAIVLKPDFTGTFARGLLRIGGTLAGLVLATALFHFVHVGIGGNIVLMAVFTLLLRLVGTANYGIFVMAVSGLVVLLIAVTGVAPGDVIAARALNTILGGSFALLAYAAWPTWERTQTRIALAEMLDAYREYFLAVTAACAGGSVVAIERVRVKGRRARSNAVASVERMGGEPGVTSRQVSALNAILVHSHSFVHAVMAMEARLYRERREQTPSWMRVFVESASAALLTLAATLREPAARRHRPGDIRTPAPESVSAVDSLPALEADRIRTSLRSLTEEIARREWL